MNNLLQPTCERQDGVIVCTACENGTVQGEFDSYPCDRCNGAGHYRVVEDGLRIPAKPSLCNYIATSGPDVVDEGSNLERFVALLLEDWSEATEDMVVWLMGDPVRAVAVIKPGIQGTQVKYL